MQVLSRTSGSTRKMSGFFKMRLAAFRLGKWVFKMTILVARLSELVMSSTWCE